MCTLNDESISLMMYPTSINQSVASNSTSMDRRPRDLMHSYIRLEWFKYHPQALVPNNWLKKSKMSFHVEFMVLIRLFLQQISFCINVIMIESRFDNKATILSWKEWVMNTIPRLSFLDLSPCYMMPEPCSELYEIRYCWSIGEPCTWPRIGSSITSRAFFRPCSWIVKCARDASSLECLLVVPRASWWVRVCHTRKEI